jgi:hypothetical protein
VGCVRLRRDRPPEQMNRFVHLICLSAKQAQAKQRAVMAWPRRQDELIKPVGLTQFAVVVQTAGDLKCLLDMNAQLPIVPDGRYAQTLAER